MEKEEWEDFQSEPNLVIQDLQLEYQKTKLQKLALIIAGLPASKGAESNLVLKGNHSIHRNPLAIQEVIRILKDHGNHR